MSSRKLILEEIIPFFLSQKNPNYLYPYLVIGVDHGNVIVKEKMMIWSREDIDFNPVHIAEIEVDKYKIQDEFHSVFNLKNLDDSQIPLKWREGFDQVNERNERLQFIKDYYEAKNRDMIESIRFNSENNQISDEDWYKRNHIKKGSSEDPFKWFE